MLLELKDGGILNIRTDRESFSGCETCDWGSQYINYFNVELTNREFKVETSQMYEHAFSEGYLMQLFVQNIDNIKNMTEDELIAFIKEDFSKHELEDIEFTILNK